MVVGIRSNQLCSLCSNRLFNKQPLAVVFKCKHLFHQHCISKNIQGDPCPFSGCTYKITSILLNPQVCENKPIFKDPVKIKRYIYIGAIALSIVAVGVLSSAGTVLVVSSGCGLSAYLMGRSVDWYFRT